MQTSAGKGVSTGQTFVHIDAQTGLFGWQYKAVFNCDRVADQSVFRNKDN